MSINDFPKNISYIYKIESNFMATYEMNIDTLNSSLSYYQAEKFIYGSSRLGMFKDFVNVLGSAFTDTDSLNITHTLGNKRYELSNHLGNVLTVISDKPIPHDDGNGNVDYWIADIKSSQDYSPFGVTLKGRSFGEDSYARGFNGMQRDDEVKERGNSYDFGARMYDTRLGRWLTIDALAGKYPSLSPYNFVANSPIIYIDPDGQRIKPMSKEAFDILLSSLPPEVRKHVKMDKNGFVKIKSAESLIQKTNSGNVKALCAIVSDERIVELYTDEKKYDYIDSKTGKTKPNEFSKPELANDFKDELDAFVGSDEEKEEYAKNLKNNGVVLDEDYYNGNFGATIRPESMQEPYPGGQISPSENIRVYINPVGLSGEQKAKNMGHELFSHVYFYLTKKDPRHGGESGAPDGNPALNAQIKERESESSENFNKK